MNVDRYLSPSEEVGFQTRYHVFVLIKDLGLALACFVLLMIIPNQFLALVFIALGIRFAWKALDWRNDLLMVTNQRLIGVSGLITRKVASIPLSMLTDLTYQRSPLGRLLGFGQFRVESAGQDQGLSKLNYVANDVTFYKTVTEMLHPRSAPVVAVDDHEKHEKHLQEAMAIVQRGRPVTSWDPDDTNPNMIVLP